MSGTGAPANEGAARNLLPMICGHQRLSGRTSDRRLAQLLL